MVSATPKQRKIAIVGSRSVGMLHSFDVELTFTAKLEAKVMFGVQS